MRRLVTAREQVAMLAPWRVAAMDSSGVHLPIEVAKHYATFNPYDPEEGIPDEQIKSRMGEYEKTLQSPEGWEGFGKGDTVSYPVLRIGESGKHAVLNGHHRVWAADKLGMSHVPMEFTFGEDDDWARKYGQPIEPHVADLLKGMQRESMLKTAQDWMSGVPTDPLDPKTTMHSFLLTPWDAYDQWKWDTRDENPPIPTPNGVFWIHVSPNDLPVGTVLAPHHKPPWLDSPYNYGLDNRANWVWTEYFVDNSDEWCSYMMRDHGECHVYKIKPRLGPFPWNGHAREGWVTDSAVITERVADHDAQEAM